ncbi:hypothetical protein J2W27_000351 [Variovorax boronicumulans]|uniref:hypothetical protein n=1 Tax=Variovorax boronicumulans TaxID=436515 RepID=UPI0027875269|nr:hypothetical protein [Variovorax boronicumulans]MDP9908258.1 hypothetical protein [Variovorax boronicumulans]
MSQEPVSITEETVKRATVRSEYNGLEFAPRPNAIGRDATTPMLMRTEAGEMFKVVKGGGSGRTSVAGFDAPFIPSRLQGRRPAEDAAPKASTKAKPGRKPGPRTSTTATPDSEIAVVE